MTSPTPKVAIVTGSGKRRIGAVVAQTLAKHGYAIVIHYHTSGTQALQMVAELGQGGIPALAVQADLTSEQAVQSLVNKTLEQFGRLDVLVNCAAIWKRRRLEEITTADIREHFETNTLGTFQCCQHAGLAMVKQPSGGCIVNFGDWAVIRPYLNYAAYFASKGAIEALTRTFAVELGTRNPQVRVNCVLPGPVLLPPDLSEAERKEAINATLVKREGSPQNVADAVLFLVENDFVTGVCLPVDGGRSMRDEG